MGRGNHMKWLVRSIHALMRAAASPPPPHHLMHSCTHACHSLSALRLPGTSRMHVYHSLLPAPPALTTSCMHVYHSLLPPPPHHLVHAYHNFNSHPSRLPPHASMCTTAPPSPPPHTLTTSCKHVYHSSSTTTPRSPRHASMCTTAS